MSMQVTELKTRLPMPRILAQSIIFLALLSLASGSLASAQDDQAGSGTKAGPSPVALSETARLILRSVEDRNPTTPEQLADATRVMIEAGLFEQARTYLNQLAAVQLDDAKMFELQQAVGSDFFLLLHTTPELQPDGRQFALRALSAAKRISTSPARLQQLINILADEDISIRSEAFRKLRRVGQPAVAAMVSAFANPDQANLFPGIRGALKLMGVHAQAPLLGAARSENAIVKIEAIRALASYDSPEAADVMMRTYLSTKLPAGLRRLALDALIRTGTPSDQESVESRFYRQANDFLTGKRRAPNSLLGNVSIWKWDTQSKQMVAQTLPLETASQILAAQQAADLYAISPQTAPHRELYLLTQLESAKRLAGPSKTIDVDEISKKLGLSQDEVNSTLTRSLALELVPAATACCEILKKIGNADLFSTATNQPCALIQAIMLGDRHLQFAAMDAIANIDPRQAYAGSSYMLDLAVFLASTNNRRTGLIGHNQDSIGQTYAATLANTGILGTSVGSSSDFFAIATSDPDLEVLVITDTLDRPDFGELIQQLRSDWRTRSKPIAFLYRDVNRSRRVAARVKNDPQILRIPISLDQSLVATHVQRLQEQVKPWPVSNLDRRRHAAAAVRWLEKIATDRQEYRFYNLGTKQQELVPLLYSDRFSKSACQIFSQIGTPLAQRELIRLANKSGFQMEDRITAVEAFAGSVAQSGTLLTTDEIKKQYNQFNASQENDAESRKVLGSILDVIESQREKADSPLVPQS